MSETYDEWLARMDLTDADVDRLLVELGIPPDASPEEILSRLAEAKTAAVARVRELEGKRERPQRERT